VISGIFCLIFGEKIGHLKSFIPGIKPFTKFIFMDELDKYLSKYEDKDIDNESTLYLTPRPNDSPSQLKFSSIQKLDRYLLDRKLKSETIKFIY